MATDPRFPDQGFTDPRFDPGYQQTVEPKKRSPWATCLIGCFILLVLLLVIGAVAIYMLVSRGREWAASAISQGIKQNINASELPAAEKAEINAQVDRVAVAFREGRLSMEKLGFIMQQIAESPLMPAFMVWGLDQAYLAKSGLSAEEKADGRLALQRLVRGLMEEKITQQQMDTVMAYVGNRQPDGQWRIRQRLTDADLRNFITAAQKAADESGVSEEPLAFDPSNEIKRIVDQALPEPGDFNIEEPPPIELPPVEAPPPVDVQKGEVKLQLRHFGSQRWGRFSRSLAVCTRKSRAAETVVRKSLEIYGLSVVAFDS